MRLRVRFNALPARTRARWAALVDAPPGRVPLHASRGATPALLSACGVAVGLAGLAAAGVQAFTWPWVPRLPDLALVYLPVTAAALGLLALAVRRRAVSPGFPYRARRAQAITARHVVWMHDDRLTLVPFDPERLYLTDHVCPRTRHHEATSVRLQFGAARSAYDLTLARELSREAAAARLTAFQADLRARRAEVEAALARGDLEAAGALDPFVEVSDWAALERASEGEPPPPADGLAVRPAQAAHPLRRHAPAAALLPILVGGCGLSVAVREACDLVRFRAARAEDTPAAYDRYLVDQRGRRWEAAARDARDAALARRLEAIRRETVGEPLYVRERDLLRLLAEHPRGPHVEGARAMLEDLERLGRLEGGAAIVPEDLERNDATRPGGGGSASGRRD
ncbi:MAG: hypothetical protein KF878_32015 [Planctomycetes bacterium]|nr:hypothetical protein [Planctomycetota bacterium]